MPLRRPPRVVLSSLLLLLLGLLLAVLFSRLPRTADNGVRLRPPVRAAGERKMDKLRSLQYFVAAAEEKSLAGAARRFGVSTQAVAKMITALERGLGVRLFDRASHGLSLTASGATYRETCLPALSQLQLADELVGSTPAQGGVVAGVQHVIAREVLTPALPRFHARHPQIQIDVRDFNRVSKDQMNGVDVFLTLGWPQASDLVLRQIASSRTIVVASPAYWAAHGMPRAAFARNALARPSPMAPS